MKRIRQLAPFLLVLVPVVGQGQTIAAQVQMNRELFQRGATGVHRCLSAIADATAYGSCEGRVIFRPYGTLLHAVPNALTIGAHYQAFIDHGRFGHPQIPDDLDNDVRKFASSNYNNFCLYFQVNCPEVQLYRRQAVEKLSPVIRNDLGLLPLN